MINFNELWSAVDWLILAAYFVAVLAVGFVMKSRAGKSVASFVVASRRLTVPILIGVAAAAWYDSWTIVGLAECGWTMGICVLFIFVIPEAVCRLPLAVIIGPHVRDTIPDWIVTVPDLIGYLYDRKVKLISAITYLANILYDSALLLAVADVMHMITGMNMIVSLIVTGGVIALYTALSGLWGLAVTDLIQFAVMTISAGALVIGIIMYCGDFADIFAKVRDIDPILMEPLGYLKDMGGFAGSMEALAWIISACAMYSSLQCYQRFSSARSGADIKVAYSIMLVLGLCFSAIMVFVGMAALTEYNGISSSPAEGFWALVFTVLPIGFRGLFVAALCAAVMSTVSADWLIFSTCVVADIFRGYIKKDLSEKKTVFGIRACIVVMGIACILGTQFWADGIANAWYYLGGFMFSMFCIPIVAGLFYKKKTNQGGLACALWSALAYVVWNFVLACPYGIPASVFVVATGAIVYFGVSNLTYKPYQLEEKSEK